MEVAREERLHDGRVNTVGRPFMELSWADRLLTPAILLAMIVGVIIGEFVPGIQQAFDLAQFRGVSARP